MKQEDNKSREEYCLLVPEELLLYIPYLRGEYKASEKELYDRVIQLAINLRSSILYDTEMRPRNTNE